MWPASEQFKRIVDFLKQPLIFVVVRQSRLEQLPASLRGYSHHANEELMRSLSVEVDAVTPEVRVFSSENNAVRYISSQQADAARPVYGFVAAPPHLLTARLSDSKAERLLFNLGFSDQFVVPRENFSALHRLARVVHVVKGRSVFVAESENRAALTTEVEGKKFAIGYRTRELTDEQERKLRALAVNAKLVQNSVRRMAVGLLRSELAGIVIDFGARQQLWQREELGWVVEVDDRLRAGFLTKIRNLLH